MTDREAFEKLVDDVYYGRANRISSRGALMQWFDARAALQSAPGQEPVGPVAEVETVYVRPNADGKYRAIVVSDERLSQGAELFVQPPTATVEAATNHDRGYLTGLLAGWNLCMEGDVAGFDSAVKTTRALIADARAEQSEHCKACSDAGVCYVCGKALASQPAQPQAEVEVEAERLKQAIINIEGARAVARADFERHPDRKTVVHCWLQDIDVVLEALSTTPQAEAQAGETPRTDVWLKRNEWRAVKTSYVDELITHTKRLERELQAASAELDRERMQLAAQPQAVEEAAKDVLAERERQKAMEGWTPEHDDEHDDGSLALAAACYASAPAGGLKTVPHHHEWTGNARYEDSQLVTVGESVVPALWPWEGCAWKPKDRRRNLVRAGALIIAEIERIDRALRNAGKEG